MTETNEAGAVPVYLTAYKDEADLEINDNHEIENHDELVMAGQTYDMIRGMDPETFEEHMHPSDRVERDSSLYDGDVDTLAIGEEIRL